MNPRYLTKSRFKLALECPAKLFYTGKEEYGNNKIEDPFLEALADGGFQVGELAKCYFPGGHDIETLSYEEAIRQTENLLQRDTVTIYEAAIRCENLFVRADILIKSGHDIELIEVKAKSTDSDSENSFLTTNGEIISGWNQYLQDIAFQKYVTQCAYPHYRVSAYLMLADKRASCPTNGLNQKFKLAKDAAGRKGIIVSAQLTPADLSERILTRVNVDNLCQMIYNASSGIGEQSMTYTDYVKSLADAYRNDQKILIGPHKKCGECEFKATLEEQAEGIKSGFHECWKESLGWNDDDFAEATILDIWDYKKKDDLLMQRRIKVSDISVDDIVPRKDQKPGLSRTQRQWLQVKKAQDKDMTYWLDRENLAQEIRNWKFPLHFIDFETAAVAIPFNKGRRPYEGIAFQFSHHVVYRDGQIEHRGQYLNAAPGVFPNYDFLRELKAQLENDQGSIFRYSHHENSILNMIYRQLKEDADETADREDLCRFIQTITSPVDKMPEELKWEPGARNMIDLLALVKRYYYDPVTNGSNSIKQVLPAILNRSRFLQEKYAQPIYGAKGGIPSLNYLDWSWLKWDNDRIVDPYKLLPKMFQDISDKDFALLSEDDQLADGGAALTAYARLQFEEMSDYERSEIRRALLKYCELDTLAMVMLYEGWKDLLGLEDSAEYQISYRSSEERIIFAKEAQGIGHHE